MVLYPSECYFVQELLETGLDHTSIRIAGIGGVRVPVFVYGLEPAVPDRCFLEFPLLVAAAFNLFTRRDLIQNEEAVRTCVLDVGL